MPHFIMMSVLASLVIVYLKLTTLQNLDMHIVTLPFFVMWALLGILTHSFYRLSLNNGDHQRLYHLLTLHLICTVACLYLFQFNFASYQPLTDNLTLLLIPLYLILISYLAIFLYFLPGLCDPENEDFCMAYLSLNYLMAAFITLLFINLNGFVG